MLIITFKKDILIIMRKSVKRIGTQKVSRNIHFEFIEARISENIKVPKNKDPLSHNFSVVWKRGSESYSSATYDWNYNEE